MGGGGRPAARLEVDAPVVVVAVAVLLEEVVAALHLRAQRRSGARGRASAAASVLRRSGEIRTFIASFASISSAEGSWYVPMM